MSTFVDFKRQVQQQFESMSDGSSKLFTTAVPKGNMWSSYLSSFPPGTNQFLRERREYDCQSCKQFIRAAGAVVSIDEFMTVRSIWDVQVPYPYQPVADWLAALVKSYPIVNRFLHPEHSVGIDINHGMSPTKQVETWHHFYLPLPSFCVESKGLIGTAMSKALSNSDVFARGLETITMESVDIVLELIEENSIYRGEEHKRAVEGFKSLLVCYSELDFDLDIDSFHWLRRDDAGARIRNTAIGTLLVALSEGVDLTRAVKSYESKVAPENYKRPKSLITKRMVRDAQSTVEQLGIERSLERRYATVDDVTIDNVLFADRSIRESAGVFDELVDSIPDNPQTFDRAQEITIEDFVEQVLPSAKQLELMFQNEHAGNLVSLIAPVHQDSPRILKWGNNFCWSYSGDVADSIKQRVKAMGGDVCGVLRFSAGWFNSDDLDIHLSEPSGNVIYFHNKKSSTGGVLDVDMNVQTSGRNTSSTPVENITFPKLDRMLLGEYEARVHQFNERNSDDCGFEAEIEFGGDVHRFAYNQLMRQNQSVVVCRFSLSENGVLKIIDGLSASTAQQCRWNIQTQSFHKVSMVMHSPNHWDGSETGNRHYFFVLDGCQNPESSRGFYNEFLSEELTRHRKVFEVLGSKMRTSKSDQQLSGLGFSVSKRDHVLCRVTGAYTRVLKLVF